jgi:thymidine kinase
LGVPILVVKHSADQRYNGENEVVTHDGRRIPCVAVESLDDVFLDNYQVVIVDEAQFFGRLVPFCEYAVDTLRKNVFLVGLDGDSNRRPFGEILQCIPLADRIERLTALCHRCANGTPGLFSFRLSGPDDQQVLVGGSERYESLCRECYLEKVSGFV